MRRISRQLISCYFHWSTVREPRTIRWLIFSSKQWSNTRKRRSAYLAIRTTERRSPRRSQRLRGPPKRLTNHSWLSSSVSMGVPSSLSSRPHRVTLTWRLFVSKGGKLELQIIGPINSTLSTLKVRPPCILQPIWNQI